MGLPLRCWPQCAKGRRRSMEWSASCCLAIWFFTLRRNCFIDLSGSNLPFSMALKIAIIILSFQNIVEIGIMFYLSFDGLLSIRDCAQTIRLAGLTLWQSLLRDVKSSYVYVTWFWTEDRSSNRFNATSCGNIVSLYERNPTLHFGRASTFFLSFLLFLAISTVFEIVW